jgi:hypothetical protein
MAARINPAPEYNIAAQGISSTNATFGSTIELAR